jgi:hypothetical protein
MASIPVTLVILSGQGFDSNSQVLVDGTPVETHLEPDGTLEAFLSTSFNSEIGVHQFAVQRNGGISNSLPLTIYTPQHGPLVMQAIPAFWLSDYAADPPFIVTTDVNGDGLSDVIMPAAGPNGTGLAIFLGQNDGLLAPVQNVTTALAPYSLAAGDVDGDGNIDLVYVSGPNGTPTVKTLLGDGHGNFQETSAQQTFVGAFPGPTVLVDIDGDGKPDLVVAYQLFTGGNSIAWLKNMGGGNFAAPVSLATSALQPFAIADFKGDGRPDIVYSTPGSPQSIHILMNQGGGNFTDQAASGLNGIAGTVNVVDFNLDGIPDLVIQVQQTNSIALYSFAGNGNGSFTQVATSNFGSPGFAPYQLVAGDFDHDGFPDLAGVNGETEPSHLLYLLGDGHGNFSAQEVVGPEGFLAAVGDFNGDGIPDVVVPDRFNFVSLSLGRGDRNFPSVVSLTPATATGIGAGDIDGDGWPDLLIVGDPIHSVPSTVFQNLQNNSFKAVALLDPGAFSLADFAGRGVVDLLVGNGNTLSISPNNGSLDFSSTPVPVPQPVNGFVTVADMDSDGHADIVSPGQVFYGDGSYQFTLMSTQAVSEPYVIGDFNGDGRLDIASGAFTYLNTGNRSFQAVRNTVPLLQGAVAVAGDFNGDGKDDIAVNLPGETVISIYYSNGDGTFYSVSEVDAGQLLFNLAVGDFDGDGRTDIAVGLITSHQICILFNAGTGEFKRAFFASGADDGGSMIATDLNRDGKPDLVITNFLLGFRPPNVDVMFHK